MRKCWLNFACFVLFLFIKRTKGPPMNCERKQNIHNMMIFSFCLIMAYLVISFSLFERDD